MRYEVQFRTSGIVAFSATEKAICQHWYDCNNYGPEMPYCDSITGEIVPNKWVKGECLELFKLVKVQNTGEVK
jgi:hypothetical protein